MKLVVDSKIPFVRGVAEQLGEVAYIDGAAIGPADVKQADALVVRTRTLCNRELLEGSRVQFIATATIGFDHLDTAWLAQAGIRWTNCPGCLGPWSEEVWFPPAIPADSDVGPWSWGVE